MVEFLLQKITEFFIHNEYSDNKTKPIQINENDNVTQKWHYNFLTYIQRKDNSGINALDSAEENGHIMTCNVIKTYIERIKEKESLEISEWLKSKEVWR